MALAMIAHEVFVVCTYTYNRWIKHRGTTHIVLEVPNCFCICNMLLVNKQRIQVRSVFASFWCFFVNFGERQKSNKQKHKIKYKKNKKRNVQYNKSKSIYYSLSLLLFHFSRSFVRFCHHCSTECHTHFASHFHNILRQ